MAVISPIVRVVAIVMPALSNVKKVFLSIVCLSLFLGCKKVSNEVAFLENDLESDSISKIKIENIDENSVIKYSEIFDDVRYIRLETKNESLIGRIDRVIATEDKFIILDSSIAKMVFVFNSNGEFLNRIGSNGGGPEEYDEPDDIAYDEYSNELLVLCHNYKSILRFRLDGTFIGKTMIDWWVNSIFVVAENAYVLFLNNYTQKDGKKNEYNIVIINKEGKILENLLPYDESTGKLSPPKPTFSYYNDEIIFSLQHFNIVYSLNNKEIERKYYWDFGKQKIPASQLKNKTGRELDKMIKDNEYAYAIASYETSSHLICQFVYKRMIFDCYYSKESENSKISACYFNDLYALSSNRAFYFLKGDSLISFIEPQSFIQFQKIANDMKNGKKDINDALFRQSFPSIQSMFIDKKIKDNYKEILESAKITLTNEEIDFVNSIDESDNPILMIAKLKNF